MAGKLFVVLFAFLAVQGWTSAGTIPDEFEDLVGNDVDLLELNVLEGTPWELFSKVESVENKKAEDCVPYISEAYSAAKEAQILIGQAKELGKKLKEKAKKCKALTNAEEKKKCYRELKIQAATEGKPIYEAYKQLKPKVAQSMTNFDKCMA